MRLLTRKNIRGCMTFLESFMSVPCFRNTCRHKHHSIDRCQQILYSITSSYKFFFSCLCIFNYVKAYFFTLSFFLVSHFFLFHLLKEKIFSTAILSPLKRVYTCMNLLQPRLWSYWTDVVTHPARLDDLVVPGEAVLNVHQFLEVILKQTPETSER